jgi:hypothetical protein
MKKSLAFAVLASGLLVACSSVPMITDRDVLVSENKGELMSLYGQLQGELKTAKPGSDLAENRAAYIKVVGKKIAEIKERAILDSLKRQPDLHDIATLQRTQEQAKEISPYSQEVYKELHAQLEQAIGRKNVLVSEKEGEFSQLFDQDAPKKVALLDEIAKIHGGEEAQRVMGQRKAYLASLFQSAESAMESKRYEDVVAIINNLAQIDSSYPGIREMRHKLIAAEYEQTFWDALGKGEMVVAYNTFRQLTQVPDYVANHPDVIPIAEDIAQFFIAEGDKNMGVNSLVAAYEAYSRAHTVRKVMGKGDVYSSGERKFIELVDMRLQQYLSDSLTVPAYGHLLILEELEPGHPSVAKYSQKIESTMLADATLKIIPSVFTEADAVRSAGLGIISRIGKQLHDTLGNRVQVIEINKAASYSSDQIAHMPNPGSYYFLSGEILESTVATNKKPASMTRRVLTGYRKDPNPEYVAWTQLKPREQKNKPKPEMTVNVPVEEDVAIKKFIIDKQGVFSISYRLADAVTAAVVFSDALTRKESHTGEQIEGIELGLFRQESVVAELPSDADILGKISEEIAQEAVQKIGGQISEIESAYQSRAEAAVIAEDFHAAVANYGYLHVLSKSRDQRSEVILNQLRKQVMRW